VAAPDGLIGNVGKAGTHHQAVDDKSKDENESLPVQLRPQPKSLRELECKRSCGNNTEEVDEKDITKTNEEQQSEKNRGNNAEESIVDTRFERKRAKTSGVFASAGLVEQAVEKVEKGLSGEARDIEKGGGGKNQREKPLLLRAASMGIPLYVPQPDSRSATPLLVSPTGSPQVSSTLCMQTCTFSVSLRIHQEIQCSWSGYAGHHHFHHQKRQRKRRRRRTTLRAPKQPGRQVIVLLHQLTSIALRLLQVPQRRRADFSN